MSLLKVIDTDPGNIFKCGVCGYKNPKKPGLPEKARWFKDRIAEGLKIKILYSEEDGTQGMIEYVPGEFCWRPVNAKGYMFIHCIFVGFKRQYKNQGYASKLLDICETDARKGSCDGVAIVTRKSSFMAGKEIFLKRGYEIADKAAPDFELLAKRFNPEADLPVFRITEPDYGDGLIIIRADQCPYTLKNVAEIQQTAKEQYGLTPRIVDLETYKDAQNSPCAFGSFCILFNNEVIAEHPISNGRFKNIMNKILN